MLRRLVIARALINRPELLLLDEPTTGLDPQARHAIWDLVRDLKRRGVTILLTTHYMEEASQLCDRLLFIDGGRILMEGSPAELVAREVGREVMECWNYGPDVPAWAAAQDLRHEESGGRLFVYPGARADALEAFERLFPHQERLLRAATLEDVFLKLTGRVLRD
jgi:lipooligosaccharide transport system ATP-binding protein